MAKYEDGFKRKLVEAYQNGEGGYGTLAQRFGIPAFNYPQMGENCWKIGRKSTTKA